ncbi:MAG: GNAT family N-acetyltransferase [Symploca sp. SIO1A3]|nr:GNAT family N-acetyltransferase [Symploca sp. SIO1A3]
MEPSKPSTNIYYKYIDDVFCNIGLFKTSELTKNECEKTNKDLISYIKFEIQSNYIYIEDVFTATEQQRKGHALYLMSKLSVIAKNKGKLDIKTNHITGEESQKFYQKLGFDLIDDVATFKTGKIKTSTLETKTSELLGTKHYLTLFNVIKI